MPEVTATSSPETNAQAERPSVDVYAVYGAEPEVQAYAMAK
jgi:hypothetical protein